MGNGWRTSRDESMRGRFDRRGRRDADFGSDYGREDYDDPEEWGYGRQPSESRWGHGRESDDFSTFEREPFQRRGHSGREDERRGQGGFGSYSPQQDYGFGRRGSERRMGYSGSSRNYGYGHGYSETGDYGQHWSASWGENVGRQIHRRGPRGYHRSDDRIKDELCERLSSFPDFDASDIEVEVSNSVVTLSGSVPERRMKYIAEDIAESVFGVEDVQNEIKTKRQQDESFLGGMSSGSSQEPGEIETE